MGSKMNLIGIKKREVLNHPSIKFLYVTDNQYQLFKDLLGIQIIAYRE